MGIACKLIQMQMMWNYAPPFPIGVSRIQWNIFDNNPWSLIILTYSESFQPRSILSLGKGQQHNKRQILSWHSAVIYYQTYCHHLSPVKVGPFEFWIPPLITFFAMYFIGLKWSIGIFRNVRKYQLSSLTPRRFKSTV